MSGFCTRFIREYSEFFKEYRDYLVLDELSQFLFIVKNIKLLKNEDLPYMKNVVFSLKNYFGRIKDNYSLDENSEDRLSKNLIKSFSFSLNFSSIGLSISSCSLPTTSFSILKSFRF